MPLQGPLSFLHSSRFIAIAGQYLIWAFWPAMAINFILLGLLRLRLALSRTHLVVVFGHSSINMRQTFVQSQRFVFWSVLTVPPAVLQFYSQDANAAIEDAACHPDTPRVQRSEDPLNTKTDHHRQGRREYAYPILTDSGNPFIRSFIDQKLLQVSFCVSVNLFDLAWLLERNYFYHLIESLTLKKISSMQMQNISIDDSILRRE